jgi:hypothetical protein
MAKDFNSIPTRMEEKKKILVLILASDTNPLYCSFQTLWKTYMNTHPEFDCYFYKGHPNLEKEAFLSDKNTLLIKCEDTFNTCYEKTLKAFDFFKDKLDNYKYVFRTNLSSFMIFDKYLEYSKEWPTENFCSAVIGEHEGIPFPAGAGFTLSIDLVKRLIEERPSLVFQDDVSIGSALKSWGIPIEPCKRVDILYEHDLLWLENNCKINEDVFHYRVKNIQLRRYNDIIIQKWLIEHFYGISVKEELGY